MEGSRKGSFDVIKISPTSNRREQIKAKNRSISFESYFSKTKKKAYALHRYVESART